MEETEQARPMRSADVGELVKALTAALQEIKPPKKGREAKVPTKDGGSYSYSYADLFDVIECYKVPLAKHGLAVVQTLRPEDGHMVLVTSLLHTSGQWVDSEYPIAAYQRPQEQGSAITYGRRYSVTGILGIAAEDDDDGQAAQRGERAVSTPSTSNGDASAILDLAAEIHQMKGSTIDAIIKNASFFQKDGKDNYFTDPTNRSVLSRPKWLASTRKRLESELAKAKTEMEPQAAETAALFT